MDLEAIYRNYFFSRKSLEQNPFFFEDEGKGELPKCDENNPLLEKKLESKKRKKALSSIVELYILVLSQK